MATGSRKRHLDEWDVSEIAKSTAASVHGVVSHLSPVKDSTNKKTKWFDGRLTDEKKSVRLVSFDPSLRATFDAAKDDKKPIAINNCIVKHGRDAGQLEVLATSKSTIQMSPRKFMLTENDFKYEMSKQVAVTDISDLAVNQRVTVVAKIISVSSPKEITKDDKTLKMQNCQIADAYGHCRVVLWEQHLSKLAEGESYQISNVAVCSYNGSKYLSASGFHTTFEQVHDIGDVTDDVFDEENPVNRSEFDGEIDAVVSCTEYPCCKACKAKVNAINSTLGECSKCAVVQKLTKCTMTTLATVIIGTSNGDRTVTMFSGIIDDLTKNVEGPSLTEKLLATPPHKFYVTPKDVVYSVTA